MTMKRFFKIPDNQKPSNDSKITEMERREFLKIGLLITGVFAGGSILSAASVVNHAFASPGQFTEKYPYKPHYSMLIKQNLCIDCELCMEACVATNNVPDYGYRTKIMEHIDPDSAERKVEFIPILCNQCNKPPCVTACPTRATYKDEANGIVRMASHKCIGCKTCMSACPYYARYFDEARTAIDKCDFCYETRLSKGETNVACSIACPAGVRNFGDLSDRSSEIFKIIHDLEKTVWVLRPEVGAKPNVFYTKG
jgi:Fe-S-cluster-containing dehydrogenase component